MTLLERFNQWSGWACELPKDEIRRALAIAHMVEKRLATGNIYQTREAREILDEADELLEEK